MAGINFFIIQQSVHRVAIGLGLTSKFLKSCWLSHLVFYLSTKLLHRLIAIGRFNLLIVLILLLLRLRSLKLACNQSA